MNKIDKILIAAPIALASAVPALAAEGAGGTANADVVNAMTTVANDMKATATAILPVALTVVGLSMVVVFGITMFNRVRHKS